MPLVPRFGISPDAGLGPTSCWPEITGQFRGLRLLSKGADGVIFLQSNLSYSAGKPCLSQWQPPFRAHLVIGPT